MGLLWSKCYTNKQSTDWKKNLEMSSVVSGVMTVYILLLLILPHLSFIEPVAVLNKLQTTVLGELVVGSIAATVYGIVESYGSYCESS